MKLSDLQKVKAKYGLSKDVERLSLGEVQPQISQPFQRPTLERSASPAQVSGHRVAVNRGRLSITLVNFRHRELDRDNLIGGCKPLRDAIALWLGMDDSEKFIDWNYAQVQTRGEQGVAVKIEVVTG